MADHVEPFRKESASAFSPYLEPSTLFSQPPLPACMRQKSAVPTGRGKRGLGLSRPYLHTTERQPRDVMGAHSYSRNPHYSVSKASTAHVSTDDMVQRAETLRSEPSQSLWNTFEALPPPPSTGIELGSTLAAPHQEKVQKQQLSRFAKPRPSLAFNLKSAIILPARKTSDDEEDILDLFAAVN